MPGLMPFLREPALVHLQHVAHRLVRAVRVGGLRLHVGQVDDACRRRRRRRPSAASRVFFIQKHCIEGCSKTNSMPSCCGISLRNIKPDRALLGGLRHLGVDLVHAGGKRHARQVHLGRPGRPPEAAPLPAPARRGREWLVSWAILWPPKKMPARCGHCNRKADRWIHGLLCLLALAAFLEAFLALAFLAAFFRPWLPSCGRVGVRASWPAAGLLAPEAAAIGAPTCEAAKAVDTANERSRSGRRGVCSLQESFQIWS